MAYVILSKTGVTTVTLSRGHLFPHRHPTQIQQRRIEAENRQVVRVVTTGERLRWLMLHLERLPLADYTALLAFFDDPLVNWSAFPFTVMDVDGTSYTVRWWPEGGEATFDFPEVAYQLYSGDLPLRIEAA